MRKRERMRKQERNSFFPVKDWVLTTGAIVLSISFLIFVVWWVFTTDWNKPVHIGAANRTAENTKPTKDLSQLSPEAEVNQMVEDIRRRVSSVQIEKSYLVFKDAPQPRFQYMLTIIPERNGDPQDAVYLFDKYKYAFQTVGDQTKIPTAQLCDLVDAVYERKDPILESLREVKLDGKLSFPVWKLGGAELAAGNLTPILVELLYSIRKSVELKTTHPEIIIKGFADGQKSDWSEELLSPPHNYTNIPVFALADPSNTLSHSLYTRNEQLIPIPQKYKNEHLPDLRAFFVKTDLVDSYLELCRKEKKIETHLIKGGEFTEKKDAPLERKVQVFILIYENKS